jgi:uncharacterized protein
VPTAGDENASVDAQGRIAPSRRPDAPVTGTQSWRDLFFFHWAFDPDEVRRVLPAGLELDLWEGQAYVGLVPFRMERVRPALLPRVMALDFLETNVRTYVHRNGEPGVLFFSLEASSWLAVRAARLGWGLPYFYATMTAAWRDRSMHYSSIRKRDGASLRFEATPGEMLGPSAPGTLEFFLLERYVLFTSSRGQIMRGQVHHRAYPAQRATVRHIEESLLVANELPPPKGELVAHYASGVDVEVFGPTPAK